MSPDLETRIVAALKAATPAAALAVLEEETEAAIAEADDYAAAEREKSLDPIASPDAQHARVAMDTAAFQCERLRALLPRVRARYDDVAATEKLAQWKSKRKPVKVNRDALAAELTEFYSEVVPKLADLFGRIAENDAEISDLNRSCPAGVRLHLVGAEQTARGLDSFSRRNPSIAKELRLPSWHESNRMVWPPARPRLDPASLPPARYDRKFSAEWWRVKEEEAEARAAAQAREAKEREAKVRENGPHWWEEERA